MDSDKFISSTIKMFLVYGVWRSLVARTAGGREVAGSNPVTPIPWQGHGRRSDPSGGLRKRETVYCGFSFFLCGILRPKECCSGKRKT